MSILIKGMEMPKNCGECPFFMDEDFTWCGRANYNICDGRVDRNSKPPWCDLIEIPPHGRLIDADALSDKIYHTSYCDPVVDWDDICAAPTIIESEGDDESN